MWGSVILPIAHAASEHEVGTAWSQVLLTALNVLQTVALAYIAARWRKDINQGK